MSATNEQKTFAELGPDFRIDVPYRTRPVRFIRNEDVGGWRIKVYGIATPGNAPRAELVDAAVELAREVFPQPALEDDRHGIGFLIVHDSRTFGMALYYWWQSTNELHQRHFLSPLDDVTALEQVTFPQANGCVWELEAVDFERRAWIEDILANPDGPDVERYLGRHFDGDV
jgi:hypothetical protein